MAQLNEEDEKKECRWIGIDLGTTYSCVAVVDGTGKVNTIADREGNKIVASWMQLQENKSWIFGQSAKDQCFIQPHHTIHDVKRWIGLLFSFCFCFSQFMYIFSLGFNPI